MPRLSRHARLWEVDTHVLGPACHVLYRYTTGEACGPNMITRNSFALNTEFVAPRFERATGLRPRARAAGSQHGRRQEAQRPVFRRRRTWQNGPGRRQRRASETLRSVLRTTVRDLVALEHLGMHGSHASGMQSVAFTPALDRGRPVRRYRAGPGHGRHQQHGARRARTASGSRRHPPGDSLRRSGGRAPSAAAQGCRTRAPFSRCWAAQGRAAPIAWRRSSPPRRCAWSSPPPLQPRRRAAKTSPPPISHRAAAPERDVRWAYRPVAWVSCRRRHAWVAAHRSIGGVRGTPGRASAACRRCASPHCPVCAAWSRRAGGDPGHH